MGQSAQGSRRDAMWGLLLSSLIIGLAAGDVNFGSHNHHNQEARGGRQDEGGVVPGGIDFSGCEEDPETGLCCIDKEEVPLQTRWCLDPTPAAPGESYDEENAL